MKRLLMITALLSTVAAQAETIRLSEQMGPSSVLVNKVSALTGDTHEVKFNLTKVEADRLAVRPQFSVLTEKNISFSQDVGLPMVPFKSIVVAGVPSSTEVIVDRGEAVTINLLSAPSQEEDCRCETDKVKEWIFTPSKSRPMVKKEYLGTYRGKPLTRVTVYAAETDYSSNSMRFYPKLRAQISTTDTMSNLFDQRNESGFDYLIVTPSSLVDGLTDFVQHKTDMGHTVKTVVLEDIGADVTKLTTFFKEQYDEHKYKYALIVGTDILVPNHKVRTSGSSRTPSDYPYFLMDSNDMIPDVHYGRVIATTVEEVQRQTQKWINYQNRSADVSGLLHMIGIASNEGSRPSDNEYIQSIEADLASAYGTVATHFYQNDSSSTPGPINDAFNKGVGYLTYMGHGSGTSWASTRTYYTNNDVTKMNNANVQQPVIIDVACQNGILQKGYLGETFLNAKNANGEGIGAAMFFGGSVNISWHPPAIMAQGIVKRSIEGNLASIGDSLLAGQLYLLENYTSIESVRDNFEWYHLFGEPSSQLYFR